MSIKRTHPFCCGFGHLLFSFVTLFLALAENACFALGGATMRRAVARPDAMHDVASSVNPASIFMYIILYLSQ